MTDLQASLADLETQIARRESRIFLRTLLLVLIPVVAAAVWLWATLSTVSDTQSDLAKVQGDLLEEQEELQHANVRRKQATKDLGKISKKITDYQGQIQTLNVKLIESQTEFKDLQDRLREAAKFDDHRYELKWSEVKTIAAHMSNGGGLLAHISRLQGRGVGWDMSNTPEKGFHSPGFIQHVLGKSPSRLERTDQPPRLGDVVVYDGGYMMVYFKDREGVEFVVGMTPLGIVSLKYDFGPKRLYVLRSR